MFCLVCFDIVDDRVRTRVVKVLKSHGQRVQKSVFECASLGEEKYLKMKNRIEDLIDNAEDTVRYYFLCKGCLLRMEYSGIGDSPDRKSYKVV